MITRKLDRALIYGAMSTLRSLTAGPITAILVGSYLSAEVQGYLYTMRSLLGFLVMAELGIGLIIVPFVSHEWSRLEINENGEVNGDSRALSRFISLGRWATGSYLVAVPILTCLLNICGIQVVGRVQDTGVQWQLSLFFYCLASIGDFLLKPLFNILEGCQRIDQVFGIRFYQGMATSAATWVCLYLGKGLWCLPIGTAASALIGLLCLWPHRKILSVFLAPTPGDSVSWRDEIWPMQWRMSLTSLGGALWMSIFSPLAFRFSGPILAGQVGMTLTMSLGITTFMNIWSQAKAPAMAVFASLRQSSELERLLRRLMLATVVTGVAGLAASQILVYALNLWAPRMAIRLLPPLECSLFVLASVVLNLSVPLSVYLRAHKCEPYMLPTLASSVLLIVLVALLTDKWGGLGMGLAYLSTACCILPWSIAIWTHYRKRWYPEL